MKIDYHEYIANNLSEFGCVIFDSLEYPNFAPKSLKEKLKSTTKTLEQMYVFPLNVYSQKTKFMQTYWTFVNEGELSPFVFFDVVRMACGAMGLGKFYACDFQTDRIYEMSPASMGEYGKLSDLKRLLKLDDGRQIVGRIMRWCGPPGYSRYYSQARVFRTDAEREYYAQYGKYLTQYSGEKLDIKTCYSLDECEDKILQNCLEFGDHTVLQFDIDNPNLIIKATILKAKNLNVKSVMAKVIFCDNLKCESVEADKICAKSIVCEKMKVSVLKTDFKCGVRFDIYKNGSEKFKEDESESLIV